MGQSFRDEGCSWSLDKEYIETILSFSCLLLKISSFFITFSLSLAGFEKEAKVLGNFHCWTCSEGQHQCSCEEGIEMLVYARMPLKVSNYIQGHDMSLTLCCSSLTISKFCFSIMMAGLLNGISLNGPNELSMSVLRSKQNGLNPSHKSSSIMHSL